MRTGTVRRAPAIGAAGCPPAPAAPGRGRSRRFPHRDTGNCPICHQTRIPPPPRNTLRMYGEGPGGRRGGNPPGPSRALAEPEADG